MSSVWLFIIFALVIGAGYVAGTFASGYFSRRSPAPVLVYGGLFLTVCAAVAMNTLPAAPVSYVPVVACMFVFTAGMGVVSPMSAACALSRHPEMAGSAAGLLGALQIVTGALGTLSTGLFGAPSIRTVAIVLAVTASGAVVAAYVALLPFRNRVVPSRAGLA